MSTRLERHERLRIRADYDAHVGVLLGFAVIIVSLTAYRGYLGTQVVPPASLQRRVAALLARGPPANHWDRRPPLTSYCDDDSRLNATQAHVVTLGSGSDFEAGGDWRSIKSLQHERVHCAPRRVIHPDWIDQGWLQETEVFFRLVSPCEHLTCSGNKAQPSVMDHGVINGPLRVSFHGRPREVFSVYELNFSCVCNE